MYNLHFWLVLCQDTRTGSERDQVWDLESVQGEPLVKRGGVQPRGGWRWASRCLLKVLTLMGIWQRGVYATLGGTWRVQGTFAYSCFTCSCWASWCLHTSSCKMGPGTLSPVETLTSFSGNTLRVGAEDVSWSSTLPSSKKTQNTQDKQPQPCS